MVNGWEEVELGSNNLAEFDYENLNSDTALDYQFRYITLENIDNGKLLQYIYCIFATSPSRARRVVHKGDLLISTVRPNLHSHYKVDNDVSNIICSTGFCVIKTNETKLNRDFLYNLFYSNIIDKQIELIVSGSNYPAINSEDIKKLEIPLPPLPEQRRIAAVLSDTDKLITALEKLTAKKRAIKQGAMQELLTGKRRLPGFSGEWGKNELGKICDIVRGGSPRPIEKYLTTSPSGINWIKIGDVEKDAKYIRKTEEKIIPEGMNLSRMVEKGDFILSNSMSFGRPYILQIDGCIHDGWLAIQNYTDMFDTEFLYYFLSSELMLNQYNEKAAGSSVQNLSKGLVSSIEVILPTLTEQSAIASILSDMDAEIDALTEKLNKYKRVKQGMMSELLTGRIRLLGDGEEVVP